MATTFPNVTFAGEHYAEVFGPVLLDPAGLIDGGLATPIDRTKFKSAINEIEDTVELKNPTSAFTTQTSTDAVEEVSLAVVPYEFHKTISLDIIRTSWFSGQLAAGSLNDYDYGQLVSMFVEKVYAPKLKLAQDHLVLRGKTGLDASVGSISFSATYNGLYPLFNASSAVRKNLLSGTQNNNLTVASVTKGTTTTLTLAAGSNATTRLNVGNIVSIRLAAGTGWTAINGDFEVLAINSDTSIVIDVDTDALTSNDYTPSSARVRYINETNIIDVMVAHVRKTPPAVRKKGAKIAIPTHLEVEWNAANAAANLNGNADFVRSAYGLSMFSNEIVFLDSAPANTIGTWLPDAVFYGFDLADDFANVEVLWQGATGNKFYNLRGGMKTGVALSKINAKNITLTTPE